MRKLLLIICLLLCIVGCNSYQYEGRQYTEFDFIRLRHVTSGINVDINTDVLYWYGGSTSPSPIFKPDGTCLTLTEWQNQKSKEREERITKLEKENVALKAQIEKLKAELCNNSASERLESIVD
jgi:hypothetical protein